jgi:hypothetical protein
LGPSISTASDRPSGEIRGYRYEARRQRERLGVSGSVYPHQRPVAAVRRAGNVARSPRSDTLKCAAPVFPLIITPSRTSIGAPVTSRRCTSNGTANSVPALA